MRRTEALQGVRMIKFLEYFGSLRGGGVQPVGGAELLGIGERTFRRWRQRYEEDGEAGLLDRRLGKVSGKRVPVDRGAEVEALYRGRYGGFTAKHFHEHLVRDHQFALGLHVDEDVPAFAGFAGAGAAARGASPQAAAAAAARHDAASGRVAARWLARPAGA